MPLSLTRQPLNQKKIMQAFLQERRATPIQANVLTADTVPPCPSGIDIAMVNKLYDLAKMQDTVPPTVRAHYEGLSAHAADCIQCGGCETRCPFGVSVIERMSSVVKLFV